MADYSSFYGGHNGSPFIIVKNFPSVEVMVNYFKQGDGYTDVNYDEYVIISCNEDGTGMPSEGENGKIFRRGYDISGVDEEGNETGGAIYIGRIMGARGYGFLIVRNYDPVINPEFNTREKAIQKLNSLFPNGYEDDKGVHPGYVITVGESLVSKDYYGFDYGEKSGGGFNGWYFLGTFVNSIPIVGKESDASILPVFEAAPKWTTWFMVEDT